MVIEFGMKIGQITLLLATKDIEVHEIDLSRAMFTKLAE